MKLYVDTSAKQVTVTREPVEKTDAERPSEDRARDGQADVVDAGVRPGRRGRRGHHRDYGRERPNVTVGQLVTVSKLEALPWATNGRNGVAFRAEQIKAAPGVSP